LKVVVVSMQIGQINHPLLTSSGVKGIWNLSH